MDGLLGKIYDHVVYYGEENIKRSKEFDHKVDEILEPLNGKKSKEEIEEIREFINHSAYYSGANGFHVGVQFAVRLMGEICLTDKMIGEE